MNTLAICIDGFELVAEMQADLARMEKEKGIRVTGQQIRQTDGMPQLILSVPDGDDIAAEIRIRRILAKYSEGRLAA